jgi:hypothetical protein
MKNFGHNSLFSGKVSNQVPPEIEAMCVWKRRIENSVTTGSVISADKYRLSACTIH